MRKFLLDDIRTLPDIDCLCRTPQAAYVSLELEYFDVYFFDHHLGEVKPGTEGGDVLKWALENNHINPRASIFLVSPDAVGKEKMRNILLDHGWFNRGIEYVKG